MSLYLRERSDRFGPIDLKHALEALQAIDPNCSRDEWHAIGRAGIAAGLTVEQIDAWSAPAENYSGERDVRAAFHGITPNGGTGVGTLWKAAMEAGWKPPEPPETPKRQPSRPRPAQAHQRPATGRAGASAAEVWARCTPATAEHGYIASKAGTPEGLRVVPEGDPLRIAGASVAGWLAVPVVPVAGGEPVSLQFIPPPGAGKKLNLPGASMSGVFIVGDLAPGCTTYLCEGIGQAWACWKATGAAAVVCFGWGRVRGVAAELRERDASARLVVVPDVGKEREAEAIAREVLGLFVMLPEGWEQNADVNDYAQREGFDALEALLLAPLAPEQRYRLLGSADLHALPAPAWRVRGVLPAQGIASIYGPSTSGKSFLALDLAAAAAEGWDWFGHRVKAGPVVYVCLEGAAGFRLRVEAWEQANGRPLPANLRVVLDPFKLTESQDVADMGAAALSAGPGALTFIDTQNAAAPGTDENSSADMGRIIEAAKALQRLIGGLVVLVHHTGKDATKGLRGHSSLLAALDAAIEVIRDEDRREWRLAKSKDGKDGEAHPFRLEVVQLGQDDEGEPITSCVVRVDTAGDDIRRAKVPQGGNQRLVYEGIRGLFKDGITGKPGAPPLRPSIELEDAVIAGAARLTCSTDKRTSRAREAITGLVARGVLGLNEGWLWTV